MDRIRIAELSSQAAMLQLASLRRNYLIAPASFAHLMQQYLTFQLAVETIFVISYSEPHHWQTFMIAIIHSPPFLILLVCSWFVEGGIVFALDFIITALFFREDTPMQPDG